MTGFKLWTAGVGSNRSTSCTKITNNSFYQAPTSIMSWMICEKAPKITLNVDRLHLIEFIFSAIHLCMCFAKRNIKWNLGVYHFEPFRGFWIDYVLWQRVERSATPSNEKINFFFLPWKRALPCFFVYCKKNLNPMLAYFGPGLLSRFVTNKKLENLMGQFWMQRK